MRRMLSNYYTYKSSVHDWCQTVKEGSGSKWLCSKQNRDLHSIDKERWMPHQELDVHHCMRIRIGATVLSRNRKWNEEPKISDMSFNSASSQTDNENPWLFPGKAVAYFSQEFRLKNAMIFRYSCPMRPVLSTSARNQCVVKFLVV